MAAARRRRDGAPSTTAPKFFKIILHPSAESLIIPTKFRERYGQNLPNRVFLKVPSGSVSEVEVIQSNGEILLHKGWLEFKERYSLGFGHLLVFGYNGSSGFDVLIYDTTGIEINYPHDVDFKSDQPAKVDDSVVLGQCLASKRGKEKVENLENSDKTESDDEGLDNPPARQFNRKKKRHSDDTLKNLSSCFKKDSRSKFSSPTYRCERASHWRMKLEGSTSGLNFENLKPMFQKKCSDGNGRQCAGRVPRQRAVTKERCIAYQKASAFACAYSSHNPFFISVMHRTFVSGRCFPNVSLDFARRNLPRKSTDLTLRLTNGKTWSVKYITGNHHAKLSSGWKDFVQDNALKVGDVCFFEVAKSAKNFVWSVTIFRS